MSQQKNRQMSPIVQNREEQHSLWLFWKKRRYVVAILALLGFFNIYALRVNLSIAIVAMTHARNVTTENGTEVIPAEFDWDSKLQGYILSSFFYGYITTQVLGGWLANRIGGKRVFGTGVVVTALLTLFTPWLATAHVYLLLAVRIVEGVFEGVTYPCIHAVWAKWAPPLERSRLATIAFSGSYIGTVVAMPACAYLADNFGWESIFYTFGTVGIIWYIVWMVVVAESPECDTRISPEELQYITDSLAHVKSNTHAKMPWKSMLLSLPVWAIVVSHFSENWGFYTLLTQLPKFMKDILDFELGQTGIMSAVPYLAMAIMIQFSGQFADWFIVKEKMTVTQVRKVFNCGAFIAQTIFMMGAAYWLSPVGTMVCLTFAVGLGAFAWAGFSVNHLDVAPQYASVLMGLSNMVATLPGILSPIISGYIVQTPATGEWQIVFYISSAVYLFGAVFYGTFASGELQTWALETEPLKQENEMYNKDSGHDNKAYLSDEHL